MNTKLSVIQDKLDNFFGISGVVDPAMSRFVPDVYNQIVFDFVNFFENRFNKLFNGLMIKGREDVGRIFCSVFPTDEVLDIFIKTSNPGDLLFLHHPITMECGDPQGNWGRGFLPIDPARLQQIKQKGLSVYSCHAPLDTNLEIGTNAAIVQILQAKIVGEFISYGNGSAGRICEIDSISTENLVNKLLDIFKIPYVDQVGRQLDNITKIAVVAGSGDKVEYFKEAEARGAQAYIAGEIHSRIDNEKGRLKFAEVMAYADQTKMSLIGVSHAASEYLVMEIQMKNFFQKQFNLETIMIPLSKWWF